MSGEVDGMRVRLQASSQICSGRITNRLLLIQTFAYMTTFTYALMFAQTLCRVLEVMDEKKCTVWEAASEVEEARVAAGDWDHLLKTESIAKFSKGDARAPYMIRLKSIEFAEAASAQALSAIKTVVPPEPVQVWVESLSPSPISPLIHPPIPLSLRRSSSL